MLIRFAVRNVKSNFRDYTTYLSSVALSILIFYMFSELRFNHVLQEYLGGDIEISTMFWASSFLILLFSVVFIWYSTSFFLTKRKKEMGLYALFGIKRSEIGQMIFFEVMITDLIALLAGLGIGALFSPLFLIVMTKALGTSRPLYNGINVSALTASVASFLVIFLITTASAFRIIYKFQLSELFHAQSKEEEALKVNKPIAVFGAFLLLIGYGSLLSIHDGATFVRGVFLFGITATPGTFLLYRQIVPWIFTGIRHTGRFYSNIQTMMNTSGTLYRVRKNYILWAVLSLLVSGAVSLIAEGYNLSYSSFSYQRQRHAFTFIYIQQNDDVERRVRELFDSQTQHKVIQNVQTQELVIPVSIAGASGNNSEQMGFISETSLRALEKASGVDADCPGLKDNESVLLALGSGGDSYKNKRIIAAGETEALDVINVSGYNLIALSEDRTAAVVSDRAFERLAYMGTARTVNCYLLENGADTQALTLRLLQILPPEAQLNYVYDSADLMAFTKLLFFVMGFIGVLFLFATCSILSFKACWEAREDLESYTILRRLGAAKKDLFSVVSRKAGTMF
ncbi:MAG: ABC transporter permease, partial [Clostridiales bacterium]|nr:ABC transporter permease [Clostridiales bacterium]